MENIIHYCWFGYTKKQSVIKKCIRSWKKIKGWKIKEWNEHNFDITQNPWVLNNYLNKRYAFVSDYVRLYVLYNYGGIYLDTDVLIKKNITSLRFPFMCFERPNIINVAALGIYPHHPIIEQALDYYQNLDSESLEKNIYVGDIISNILAQYGDISLNKTTLITTNPNITVYSSDYFFPIRWNWHVPGAKYKTKNTIGEHLFLGTWHNNKKYSIKTQVYRLFCYILGVRFVDKIFKAYS